MPIDIYYMAASAPCRAVIMLAKELKLDINLIEIDIMAEEQMKPEFIAINPQHMVPTINDNGFYLWESKAILCYFVNKYAEDDALYHYEPEKRAIIDRMLYFDLGTLYRAFIDYAYPQILMKTSPNPAKEQKLHEALDYLNSYLEKTKFVASDTLTIADFSILATTATIETINVNLNKHPRVRNWYQMIKNSLPYFDEVNQKGLADFHKWILEVTT